MSGASRRTRTFLGLAAPALLVLTSGTGRAGDASSFPLRADPSGRFLVDAHDRPFRIQGDAAWDVVAQLPREQLEIYLGDRAARGFNTLLVEVAEHKRWVAGSRAPSTFDGIAPFRRPGDFSTPNDAYFLRVAEVVDRAAARGMLVLITPMYLGYVGRDEGWWTELNDAVNGREVCFRFGEYLARGSGGTFRGLKDKANVVWVEGGDFFPPAGSEGSARAHRILEGLQSGGARQLQTGHWSEEHLATDQPDFAAAMDVNAVYTYGPAHDGRTFLLGRRGYAHAPGAPPRALPSFLIETEYESDGWLSPNRVLRPAQQAYRAVRSVFNGQPAEKPTRPEDIRRNMYRAALSVGGGAVFGNEQLWAFGANWEEHLDTAGSRDMRRLGTLLDSVGWNALVPSGLGSLSGKQLIAGRDDVSVGGDIAAAASPSALLAYVSSAGEGPRTFGVLTSVLGAPVRARWVDPTGGASTLAAACVAAADGSCAFRTPGKNGAGARDWVLVVLPAARLTETPNWER